ncbi:hypothetical protein L2E82_22981 [Cichorium intybus]|uniref:Uncharacterized protein n=1 Tax=Cichorium intybus TaxID=13427 RepID=A0ACB9DZA0_CICIN|nr:hypothetical protein L2E82_22981 [Cichorium intybus]
MNQTAFKSATADTSVPHNHLEILMARSTLNKEKLNSFAKFWKEGSSPDVRYERIGILNALGTYFSYPGKIKTKQKEKEDYFILATQYYNKASRIDMHEPSTWVGKAFKIVLDGDRDNVPALLGNACVEFNRGKYSSSLEMYKRILQVYPQCPAAVRLDISHCRYKLSQFGRAKQAFERILQARSEVERLMQSQRKEKIGVLGLLIVTRRK